MELDNRQSNNEALLAQAMPAIRSIAREVHGQHPPVRNLISYEDLVSEGVVGALQAAASYNPELGSFPHFARKSIHGHMVEMHRRHKMRENNMLITSLSYEAAALTDGAHLSDRCNSPDATLQAKEYRSIIADAMGSLPKREATILQCVFYNDQQLTEVGDQLNVCMSRVSQLKHEAMSGMRAALEERGIGSDELTRGDLPTRLCM